MFSANDDTWMRQAIALAEEAAALGEVPVGALVVYGDSVLGRGQNRSISEKDPTAHAEVMALREAAGNIQNYRLPKTTLYVTLEPCLMCVGALLHARVARLVFGAYDPKAGAVTSVIQSLDVTAWNHRIAYQGGLRGTECGHILSHFFRARR